MILTILFILIFLWILGIVQIPNIPDLHYPLFNLGSHLITVYDLLIFIILLFLLGLLPSPFKQIAGVFLILWLLSFLGIIAIAFSSNLIVLAIIAGLVLYVISGRS
mgnify:CR=1